MKNFTRKYKEKITQIINEIDVDIFNQIIKTIEDFDEKCATIYIVGNGGSAATASHMQNDLGVGLKRRGILNLNIVSLCDNLSVITALANDVGYENIFHSQLKDKITKDDLLIAISCSGNSENIIKAAEYAKKNGAVVLGMTGFDGGKLKKMSDISYHIQTEKEEYGLVEDLHMILDHMIYTYFIERNNGR
jgi:D-sedoheptulose 7-phosphate isomerase